MKTNIVKIGNSKGIRIPKPILEQVRFGEEVELEVRDRELVVRSSNKSRDGWEDRFRIMEDVTDDPLLETDTWPSNTWDEKEWEW